MAGTAVGGGESRKLVRGQALKLRASADDQEDGDLSATIIWWSSRDGRLADGAALETSILTPGIHRVRALVVDRGKPAASRSLPERLLRGLGSLFEVGGGRLLAEEAPEAVTAEFPIEVVDPAVPPQSAARRLGRPRYDHHGGRRGHPAGPAPRMRTATR